MNGLKLVQLLGQPGDFYANDDSTEQYISYREKHECTILWMIRIHLMDGVNYKMNYKMNYEMNSYGHKSSLHVCRHCL